MIQAHDSGGEPVPVTVDGAEVRRLYSLVLEIRARIRDLVNQAEEPDEQEWALQRRESVNVQHEGNLRYLRTGAVEHVNAAFDNAVANGHPLDEAPEGLREHIDMEINPLLDQLAREYRAMTHPWYEQDDQGVRRLRPEVSVQLQPIALAIAADVDAGRRP